MCTSPTSVSLLKSVRFLGRSGGWEIHSACLKMAFHIACGLSFNRIIEHFLLGFTSRTDFCNSIWGMERYSGQCWLEWQMICIISKSFQSNFGNLSPSILLISQKQKVTPQTPQRHPSPKASTAGIPAFLPPCIMFISPTLSFLCRICTSPHLIEHTVPATLFPRVTESSLCYVIPILLCYYFST